MGSSEELEQSIDAVFAERALQVEQYAAGKSTLGFLVGMTVKRSGGTLDPELVSKRVEARLGVLLRERHPNLR